MVIFGADFVDTKFLKVRIGETVLSKIPRRSPPDTVGVLFHSPGVLIVNIPRGVLGNSSKTINVNVSNDDGKKWSRASQYARVKVVTPIVMSDCDGRDPQKLIEGLTETIRQQLVEHFKPPTPPRFNFGVK